MKHYPIYLDIQDRPCLVIGGGEVGERKVERLLDCGARVTVVSPALTPYLRTLRDEGRIRVLDADYETGQIAGAFLVIGATDREEINDRIARDCRKRGILVNIVDDPARCDFILPALCERGDLSLAVSTSGRSPALAKRIRRELEGAYGDEYAVLLRILGDVRGRLQAPGRSPAENRDVFDALLDSPLLDEIRRERWDRVQAIVREIAGLDVEGPRRG